MKIQGAPLGNCPACSAPFDKKGTTVIEESREAITLHIDCSACGSSSLVAIQADLKGFVATVGMPTDLTKADLAGLKGRRAINADDVLRLHTFLKNHSNG